MKYATKHLGMSSMHLEKYAELSTAYAYPNIQAFTPQVIEERQMNIVGMDVFSRLMMDRIIFLGVQVTDYVANVIQAQLLFLESTDPKRDVQMFINSPGGSVFAGLGMYDTMQYVQPDIATICTGIAASMGAVLLCAGTKGKRSALNHSRVMIHQPLGGAQGQAVDIEIQAREILYIKRSLNEMLAANTGKPLEQIEQDTERDFFMSPAEAQQYGLIDRVLTNSKSLQPSVLSLV